MAGGDRTRGGSPQGIAGALPWPASGRRAAALGIAALLVGAPARGEAAEPGDEAAARLRAAEPVAGAVVVRMAFDAGADLDLYVTGPHAETVYFANTPSKLGGRLLADRRCDAPGTRVETVVFPELHPGPYRVGVDFPERCDDGRGEAGFAVEVRSPSGLRERRGRLAPGTFEPAVLEWTEPAPPTDGGPPDG